MFYHNGPIFYEALSFVFMNFISKHDQQGPILKLTSPSAPPSLDLNLVLKEAIAATERNHRSPTQIQLVQLVQNGCRHNIRH